jgi:hypothetical protein
VAIAVMNWVLEDAPDLPPHCFSVLMALASKAREDGTAAYPGQDWLADRARKSDRSVRNDLAALEKLGLIRRGDQSIVSHLPADERPVVWDLAVERVRERKHTSGRKHTAGPKRGAKNASVSDQGEQERDRKPTSARKSTAGRKPTTATGRKPASAYTSPHTSTTQPPTEAAAGKPRHTQDTLDGTQAPPPSMTITQRSKRITDAYAAAEPMCKWPAVNNVVIKAIKAERWTDDVILAAVLRLAEDRRSVTVDTLRYELDPPDNVRRFPQAANGSPGFGFGPLDNVNSLWEGRR